jgi:hypothetical protein
MGGVEMVNNEATGGLNGPSSGSGRKGRAASVFDESAEIDVDGDDEGGGEEEDVNVDGEDGDMEVEIEVLGDNELSSNRGMSAFHPVG